jgi:hypothetical protein
MPWVTKQVTLNATATQLFPPANSTSNVLCRQILIQNNAAHNMRLGDSTVSATNGIALSIGGGTFNSGPVEVYNSYLSDFWIFGTASDVVDVFYNL